MMTAEVVVLNKSAIAVAADSAVTRGKTKVHVTADKIFQLSRTQPVGIVIYGNAEVLSLPWEVVVKIYRGRLGEKTFDTLDEYADDFCKFLEHPKLLTEAAIDQDRALIFLDIAHRVARRCDGYQGRAFAKHLASGLKGLNDSISKRDLIPNLPPISLKTFRMKYAGDCRAVLDEVLRSRTISAGSYKSFERLCWRFCRCNAVSAYLTGFSIFGFGAKQLLPTVVNTTLDGAPLGALRFTARGSHNLDRSTGRTAAIFALAQADATTLFMEGISSPLRRFTERLIEIAMKRVVDEVIKPEIANQISPNGQLDITLKLLRDKFADLSKGMKREINSYIGRTSINRVLDALDGLAKEDLANLAEALVELTAIQKRVSREIENVAGPIDVAVVSKADGFIWIKRKHYFNTEFNLHYIKNFGLNQTDPLA